MSKHHGGAALQRQKIFERDDFTYDEKVEIAQKSDERCCHCGKKVYFGYGASVDHFIPLSKGGTNRAENRIMLCSKCNNEKSDLIVSPYTYLPYLKGPYRKKLEGYFDSFISSFEYVERRNLLCCDVYEVDVDMLSVFRQTKKAAPRAKSLVNYHQMKRAEWPDAKRLLDYYLEYLKRHDRLEDEETARLNIEFWMKFGCIYYVEKNNEIKMMACAMITDASEREDLKVFLMGGSHFLTLSVFSQYVTPYSCTLANGMINQIVGSILQEQHLTCLPVRTSILADDRMTSLITGGFRTYSEPESYLEHSYGIETTGKGPEMTPEERAEAEKGCKRFFDKFKYIEDDLDKWFAELATENTADIEWLKTEIKLAPLSRGKGETEADDELQS